MITPAAALLVAAAPGCLAFVGGSSFFLDSVQSMPVMVEGTMYVPE
jgi:hypothetical protein